MNDDLYLRNATSSDFSLLYDWVNDGIARENAFNSHIVSLDEHSMWFEKVMKDNNQVQCILMKGDKPIGQIRLCIDGFAAEIDYSISKDERGNGYGTEIIRLIIEKVNNEYPSIKKLIGKVKPSNIASLQCFTKSGFEETYRQFEYTVRDISINM